MRIVAILGVLSLMAGGLPAQEPVDSTFAVVGKVVDYGTAEPIAGAAVEIRELNRRTVTDRQGQFAFPGVVAGRYTIVASMFGHGVNERSDQLRPGIPPLTIGLVPEPIVLQGIRVTVSRLESRRRSTTIQSQVFRQEDIYRSTAGNALDYLAFRGVNFVSCGGRANLPDCIMNRGASVKLNVILDEAPSFDGVGELSQLRPMDIHTIELYPSVAMVRVYTVRFMENLARRPRTLEPICTTRC